MHVFCSYSCAVKRKIVPKATSCVFLGYAQSGYRCYDVKSKRLDVSLNVLFNGVASYIFLNLINHPRAVMEMYCGLLLFINSNLILLQLMLRISLTSLFRPAALLSIFCRLSACSAELRGFQSPGPAQHVYFRRRLQSVSQAQATPEDQPSSPVASSDSGSLSQVRRSSQVSYLILLKDFFLIL